MERPSTESFPGLRARVLGDAVVVAVLIAALATASVTWELPELISGTPWRGSARPLAGHLLVVVAGALTPACGTITRWAACTAR